MFLTSVLTALTSVSAIRHHIRKRDPQPDLEGILDELFAVWPLEAEEERAVRERYATRH